MREHPTLLATLAIALFLAAACDEAEPALDASADGSLPRSDAGLDGGARDAFVPMDAGDAGAGDASANDAGDAAIEPSDSGADAGEGPPPRDTFEVTAGETATGFVDGVGSRARMNGIAGAALSPDGTTLYVADTFNSLLRTIDVASGTVTTVIGAPNETAVVDGVGTAARVGSPRGMAIAPDGSALYVADTNTIRRVALPSFEITTLVGVPGMSGYADGVGDEVRFAFLVHDMVVSADGATVYLADRSNRVIRALDPATRTVTTVAGVQYSGAVEHADGTGDAVRLSGLGGMARVDDVIYFADTFNNCIRSFDTTTGEVATLAGDPSVRGNEDGAGAAASFDIPQQLSTDGESLYVMGFNGAIRRVRLSDAQVDTILGDSEDVRAVDGVGAAVRLGVSFGPSPLDASAGILYFNDRDANSFREVELSSLTVTTVAGAVEPSGARDGDFAEARFAGPEDIACTADGSVCYLSDSGNHTIRRLDRTLGQVTTLAGAAGEPNLDDGDFADARFAAPAGLALDETNERLYVADEANHTLRVLDLAAMTVTTLAGEAEVPGFADGTGSAALLDTPVGLALSSDAETLFVSESGNRVIRSVAVSTGAVALLAGEAGTPGDDDGLGAAARFRRPGSLALSPDGATLYVGDRDFSNGNVIRQVTVASGAVGTLVGVPDEAGVADGSFAEARLRGPWGLAFSPEGDLLVAELRNGVVRRVDLGMERVDVWLGDAERIGNRGFGAPVSLADATLYFPAALAVAGEDLMILAEDAVLVARPEGAW